MFDNIKTNITKAAQTVYDNWVPDLENGDDEWNGGGICHEIAEAIVGVIDKHGIEATSMQQSVGENHTFVVFKTNNGIFSLDIPPNVYEIGSGYKWTKKPNVTFTNDDIFIDLISKDLSQWDQYSNELNESVEPQQPSSKITKSTVIKNKGTHRQKPITQYQFTTKNGNNVKVQLSKTDDSADIVFYVNDTLNDGSSGERDPEILNGVLYLMKILPKRANLNTLTFSAWSGNGDNKILKNIPIKEPKEQFLKSFEKFIESFKKFTPTPIPHSQFRIDLAKKFDKPLIQLYDLNKERISKILNDLNEYSKTDDTQVYGLIGDLHVFSSNNKIIETLDGYGELIKNGYKYAEAILSNTESGVPKNTNRRQSLYSKIINKFFKSDWNIEQSGSSFTMTKRQTPTIESLKESIKSIFGTK